MSRTPEQRKSDAQEKRTAKTYGGTVNAMSGAGWVRKADVRTPDFMIENKTKLSVDAKSYTLKATDLRDLNKRARLEGRIGLLQLDMGGHSYVILRETDFLDLLDVDDE